MSQGDPMRTIVVWCPDWPVQALIHAERAETGEAVVIVEKGVVYACSAAARREGARRGLKVREAQARCPALTVLGHDADLDHRMFEPVLSALEQACPGVQPIRPGLCALRARGPSRYYGGEELAAAALLTVVDSLGVEGACIGIADGPFAAEQAARDTGERNAGNGSGRVRIVEPQGSAAFLYGFDVAVLGDPELVPVLRRLGLHRLGDVAALSPLDMRARFGETGVRAHALASGRDGRAVVGRTPQKSLEKTVAFEPGLDRVDAVAFGVRAAADEFVADTLEAGLVCTALTVRLQAESGESAERTWLHPRWFTAADVIDRVRWQVQPTGARERGLDSAIVRVTVVPDSVDDAAHHEDGLIGGGPDERVHHALSRVQSMLGHDAVATAAVTGGRLLAERQLLVPWGDRVRQDAVETATQPWPGHLPSPLPATVFSPPPSATLLSEAGEPVDVTGRGVVTGSPAWLSVDGASGRRRRVAAWAGPWTVEERWWDAAQAVSVHRFHVVDEEGMAWLLLLDRHDWRVEARYD